MRQARSGGKVDPDHFDRSLPVGFEIDAMQLRYSGVVDRAAPQAAQHLGAATEGPSRGGEFLQFVRGRTVLPGQRDRA